MISIEQTWQSNYTCVLANSSNCFMNSILGSSSHCPVPANPTVILTKGGEIAEIFSRISSSGYLWYNRGIKNLQLAVFKRNWSGILSTICCSKPAWMIKVYYQSEYKKSVVSIRIHQLQFKQEKRSRSSPQLHTDTVKKIYCFWL